MKNENLRNLPKELIYKIRNSIGLNMKVSLRNSGEIPRSEGGKLNRIVDLRR